MTCRDCGLCRDDDRLRAAGLVIAFQAHGSGGGPPDPAEFTDRLKTSGAVSLPGVADRPPFALPDVGGACPA